MLFYFIRHAQSVNNAHWTATGSDEWRSEDPEITDLGMRQAEVLADFLATGNPRGGIRSNGGPPTGFDLTHIYSSYMVRAIKTGTIVAERLGLPLKGLSQIHERGGIYLKDHDTGKSECLPGKDRSYLTTYYPKFILPDDFIDTGWWDRRPVETDEECYQRARLFLDELLKEHGGTEDRVAIVSHGGFYNDFLWNLLDIKPQNRPWFLMYNTAVTRIEFHERKNKAQEIVLTYQNRVEHLSADLIT
jgi:2,3-bisphosphoglycerate-dependent phosphoglycerate mutase